MATLSAMERLRKQGEEHQAMVQEELQIEEAVQEEVQHELQIAAAKPARPQILVRLHGPRPVNRRIVALPQWYPGESVVPAIIHPVATVAGMPRKAWSLFRALTGGFVREEALTARNEVCAACPYRQVHVRQRWFAFGRFIEASYCGACGCGRWLLARLGIKNRMVQWRCPLRRWDAEKVGPYPDDAVRAYLVEHGHATEDDLRPVGGCGGCGGTSNGRAANTS